MNQYSEEIQAELTRMSNKYNIDSGILLFEERDVKDGDKHNRVIVFQSDNPKKPDAKAYPMTHFARMFMDCVNVSKTFQRILDLVNELSLQRLFRDIVIDEEMKHPTRRAD